MKAITIFLRYVLIINMPRIFFIGRADTFTSDILEILAVGVEGGSAAGQSGGARLVATGVCRSCEARGMAVRNGTSSKLADPVSARPVAGEELPSGARLGGTHLGGV